MDPNSTSESSIPPHGTAPSPSQYTGQNDLVSQSLAGFLGSTQGSEVNVGLSSHPPYPYIHSHESSHVLIPGYVPIPHCQGQSSRQTYPQPASLPGEGPPSQTDFHTTPEQWNAARWRDPTRQMEQAGIATHDPYTILRWPHRVPGPSAPMEPPPPRISDMLPSHAQPYPPSGVQAPHRTSTEHHNEPDVDPGTDRALSESPEASTKLSKKKRDMLRKRDQRADDRQHFAKICKLLKIPLSPKNTLAQRILVCVDQLVKQRKLDDALRRRLEAGEIDLAVLREELAQDSNETVPGSSDIGETASHGLCAMGIDADQGHN